MVKQSTHLILAVSGHKYPHGEHTPAEVQSMCGYPTLNNFNLKRGQVMYGVWGGPDISILAITVIRIQHVRPCRSFTLFSCLFCCRLYFLNGTFSAGLLLHYCIRCNSSDKETHHLINCYRSVYAVK